MRTGLARRLLPLAGALLIAACSQSQATPAPARNMTPTPAAPSPVQPISPADTTREPEGSAGELRFLALGDSYTIGQSVPATERWPAQLARRLREEDINVGEPLIIARTGWTTRELSAAIDNAGPGGPYDLVTLLIGVNDQFRGLGIED